MSANHEFAGHVDTDHDGAGGGTTGVQLHFTLYIAGASTVRSMAAKRRLERLISLLEAEVHVDVVDVLEEPSRAELGTVFATPTLVRELPPPGQRVIGDLAHPRAVAVAVALGLGSLMRPGMVNR